MLVRFSLAVLALFQFSLAFLILPSPSLAENLGEAVHFNYVIELQRSSPEPRESTTIVMHIPKQAAGGVTDLIESRVIAAGVAGGVIPGLTVEENGNLILELSLQASASEIEGLLDVITSEIAGSSNLVVSFSVDPSSASESPLVLAIDLTEGDNAEQSDIVVAAVIAALIAVWN